MERKLTPQQALREYFLHRMGELKYVIGELERIRSGWWIGREVRTRDLKKHTAFLRDLCRFMIEHHDLSQPTHTELATLEHDLRLFEAVHAEVAERLHP